MNLIVDTSPNLHGSVEIPAILIAGQAGLLLASALIGKGTRDPLKVRMRQTSGDLVVFH